MYGTRVNIFGKKTTFENILLKKAWKIYFIVCLHFVVQIALDFEWLEELFNMNKNPKFFIVRRKVKASVNVLIQKVDNFKQSEKKNDYGHHPGYVYIL